VRVLGLDIGEKRIGVAVSDRDAHVATPLVVLDARRTLADAVELRRILEDYEIGTIVAGLPLSLDGTVGPQAGRVARDVERLSVLIGRDIETIDERLTSAEAKRRMRETGASERVARGSIDMVAAAILLQTYLDRPSPD
jgi:putative Holliday junction resolvase